MLLVTVLPPAQAAPDEKVDTLIDAMHIAGLFEATSAYLMHSLDKRVTAATRPGEADDIHYIFRQAFAAEHARSFFQQEFREQFSEHELDAILRWYNSETGRLITACEVDHLSKEAIEASKAFMPTTELQRELKLLKLKNIRRKSAAHIESLLISASGLDVATGIIKGQAKTTFDRSLADYRLNHATVLTGYEVVMKKLVPYMYRTADNGQLQAYLTFLESDEGRKIYSRFHIALNRALADSFRKLIALLQAHYP